MTIFPKTTLTKGPEKGFPNNPNVMISCEQATLIKLAKSKGLLADKARVRLIKENYRWIKSKCQKILSNQSDANDATQEAAIRIYCTFSSFGERSSLRTWMGAIVFNECMNIVRRNQRLVVSSHIEQLLTIHQSSLQSQHADNSVNEHKIAVHLALKQLSSKARDILSLRFYADQSLEEMSNTLGISLSATKMRFYRALEQFKACYVNITTMELSV